METHIDLQALQVAEIIRLAKLASEAMTLSLQYDPPRFSGYCKLVAACNAEVLARRHRAARHCGTALALSAP